MSNHASEFQQVIDAAILQLRKLPKDEKRDALIVEAVGMLEAEKTRTLADCSAYTQELLIRNENSDDGVVIRVRDEMERLQITHPDWTAEQLHEEVCRIFKDYNISL
jgi:hypothetical protein